MHRLGDFRQVIPKSQPTLELKPRALALTEPAFAVLLPQLLVIGLKSFAFVDFYAVLFLFNQIIVPLGLAAFPSLSVVYCGFKVLLCKRRPKVIQVVES
jgi:hypothetical protein